MKAYKKGKLQIAGKLRKSKTELLFWYLAKTGDLKLFSGLICFVARQDWCQNLDLVTTPERREFPDFSFIKAHISASPVYGKIIEKM